MSKRDDVLRGGLNALFGESKEVDHTGTGKDPENTSENDPEPDEDPKDVIHSIEDDDLKEALKKKRMEHRGRPRKNFNFESVTEGYGRITSIVNLKKMEKLREIGYRETLTIKEVLEACMDLAIQKYEQKNGTIQITRNRKGNVKEVFGDK
jgi:hypothetical protein